MNRLISGARRFIPLRECFVRRLISSARVSGDKGEEEVEEGSRAGPGGDEYEGHQELCTGRSKGTWRKFR